MAAYYPDEPSAAKRIQMTEFLERFGVFYPCEHCAVHFRAHMTAHPPDTSSAASLSQWMCEAHNEVNERQGKPIFDCSLLQQRWKDGWDDGSCD
jgi:FAD-linked sulfhydryl oxidase